jgi:hypothetical protein
VLEGLGIRVGDPIPVPEDTYTKQRQLIDTLQKPKPETKRNDPLKKFLENDRKVLRFFVVWNDTSTPYGDVRKFVCTS